MERDQSISSRSFRCACKRPQPFVGASTRGPYIGLLNLPGGRVEHEESPKQTLVREVEEETGIILTAWQLLDNFSVTYEYQRDGKNISRQIAEGSGLRLAGTRKNL